MAQETEAEARHAVIRDEVDLLSVAHAAGFRVGQCQRVATRALRLTAANLRELLEDIDAELAKREVTQQVLPPATAG